MTARAKADEFMTTRELSEYLNVPVRTIEDWRYKGTGPASERVVGQRRYRRSVVDRWLRRPA